MSEWLNILIGLSVAGSSVFVLSFFITLVSKERIHARWHYWNRKLSLFFYLIPIFLIPGIYHIFSKENQLISFENISIVDQNTVWLTTTFILPLFMIWIIGVIVTSLCFWYWYRRFNKKLKKVLVSVPRESNIQHLLYRNMKNMKLANNIDIKFCKTNMSPVLIGIFKPTIVLPMYDIPYDELDMIIKHEVTHFKKRDLWIKKVMLLATILHWYNPLIYVLRKEVNKWSELSCDEDVVMEMSHSERKKYGETILNMIKRANQDVTPSVLGASFTTGSANLKNRLIKILKVKKGNKRVFVLSVTVLLTLGCIGVASSAFTHENTSIVSDRNDLNDNEKATLEFDDESTEEVGGDFEIISVKKSDESFYSKEDWQEILKQIENNEIILEDE
ncbi:M56 family metallopeptidase [Gracilibacillus alcaliphilus]|uniref:M56 family metallopeptidase n=1 Tax=Gracilibacillus alcaliphilus TaxID=1401441 RepID=UPI00195EB1D1|nr:M56 family metallopeptidase [Gracilibacillus alcaliphilus]MBM7678282.1 beta-lactamase regulating signal transducer with metallopeptidase domain [Gracilibacillus alcaliphilus]